MAHDTTDGSRSRNAGLRIVVVALLAALCWFAWLGWDTEYQVDDAGIASGPYEAWQVAGAALSLVVVVALGTLMVGAVRTVVTVSVAFAASWAVSQALRDTTGLWLVGALLTVVGVAAGASVVAWLTAAATRKRGTATT